MLRRLRYSGKLLREFVGFAREYNAYWIVPLVIVLGFTAFLVATSQGVAPYIYALF
jgi:hypothetical protein